MSAPSTSPAAPPPNLAANAGFAMSAKAVYLVSRLLLAPLMLAHISLVEYGLWSAAFVLIMYIGLSDAGFSNVYVRFVARYHASGDTAAINRLVSTGIFTMLPVAVLVWLALWLALPHVLDFLKVDAEHRATATILILGAAAMYLVDLSFGAFCYLLHGLQRIRDEQKVAIGANLLELALVLVFLNAGMGVLSLLAAFVARYCWSLSSYFRLAHRFVPGLQVRPRHYDRSMLRHFFGFGSAVQASALIGTALFSIDRVIAGFLLGPKGIALFELGAKLPVSANTIPSAISSVTLPAAARHAVLHDKDAILALHRRASRAVALVAGLPLAFMAIFAVPIAFAWLGPREDLAELPTILALTALWAHLHVTTGPGSAIHRGTGRIANEFAYHALRIGGLAIAIGASLLLQGPGAVALVTGLALGNGGAALAYLVFNQRRLGQPVAPLLREILLPGFTAYPVAALLFALWQGLVPAGAGRWETLALLAAFGTLYVALYALACWTWHLDEGERAAVRNRLARFAPILKWRNS